MKNFALAHGLTGRVVHLGAFAIMVALLAAIAGGTPKTTLANSEECTSQGLIYIDKLDGIPDLDNMPNPLVYQGTTEQNRQVTVTWNKIQGEPGEILSISPSDFYDSYVAKWGVGGGLSHITFCGDPDPDPTATVPSATSTVPPTATATVPVSTATPTDPVSTATPTDPVTTTTPTDPVSTATPTDPVTTATPTDPASTATPTDPATSTAPPTVTATSTQSVNTLPTTGSSSGGPGGINLMLLMAASSVLFISATILVQRGWGRKQ